MAVQARVQRGQDGRQQQEPDSEAQVEQNSLSSSRVSDQCWLRWESLRVSRRRRVRVIATGRVAAYQLTSTVLIACPRSPDDQGDGGEVCVECGRDCPEG